MITLYDRTWLIGNMLPKPKDGVLYNVLDACTKFIDPTLKETCWERNCILTTWDIEPEVRHPRDVGAIRKVDLRYAPLDKQFDIVICSDTLEHIDRYELVLDNLGKLVVLGGLLYLHVPALRAWYTWDNHSKIDPTKNHHRHEWNYAPRKLRQEVIDRGFISVLELHGFDEPGVPIGFMFIGRKT